jgi:hypothetical protein
MTAADVEVTRAAGALLTRVDALAERMFAVLAREPSMLPTLTPELAAAGAAVARADLAHELRCLADGAHLPAECPEEVRMTARRAVQLGSPLAFPLQCYRAGHRVLWTAWRDEARTVPAKLRDDVLQTGETFFFDYADRCCALVADAYAEELAATRSGLMRRRLAIVRRVLAGDADPAHVGDYALDGEHLALVCTGPEAEAALADVTARAGGAALTITLDEETAWAWLPGPVRAHAVTERLPRREATIGVGAPGAGVEGFARTHRQAQQALRVALAREMPAAAYGDVALEALCTTDTTAAADFTAHTLAPLRDAPALLQTLDAWLAAGMRSAATATALGVSGRTVHNRLRAIEQRTGRRVQEHATALDVALKARRTLDA